MSAAGCLGGPGGGGLDAVGERPAYSRWIGAEHLAAASAGGDGFLFVRTDASALRWLGDGQGEFGTLDREASGGEAYELVAAPLLGTVGFLLIAGLGLAAYGPPVSHVTNAMRTGWSGTGTPSASTPTSPHTVDVGLLVGQLVVFEGEFDLDAFETSGSAYHVADSYGGYTIYEGTGVGFGAAAGTALSFGADDHAVLVPVPTTGRDGGNAWESFDPTAVLHSHIDVASGDAQAAADADADFDWLLRAGGREDFVLVGSGMDGSSLDSGTGDAQSGPSLTRLESLLRDVSSFATSTSFDGDRSVVTADGGFSYPTNDARPDRSAFEALVPAATDSTVTLDDDRARVEAEWDGQASG